MGTEAQPALRTTFNFCMGTARAPIRGPEKGNRKTTIGKVGGIPIAKKTEMAHILESGCLIEDKFA